MRPQESIPAGQDAIPRATVEITKVRGRRASHWQVRDKTSAGVPFCEKFLDLDEAYEWFWKKADELKKEAKP